MRPAGSGRHSDYPAPEENSLQRLCWILSFVGSFDSVGVRCANAKLAQDDSCTEAPTSAVSRTADTASASWSPLGISSSLHLPAWPRGQPRRLPVSSSRESKRPLVR